MSETYVAPTPNSGWLSKRVAGIPVVYLVGAVVAILVIVAYMGSKKNTTGASTATNAPVDPYATLNSTGTVTTGTPVYYVGDNTKNVDTVATQTNADWQKKVVEYLVGNGSTVGDAQSAIQAYVGGQSMTYAQGQLVNSGVAKFGIPPTITNIGTTAPATTTNTSTPTDAVAGGIQGYYNAYLRRNANAQEVADWERLMAQQNLPLDTVRQDIANSAEAKA